MEGLAWTVERACAVAWPPLRAVRVGDWQLGLSGGGSRRINAASPIGRAATLATGTIAAIAQTYAQDGQPAIVRLPTLVATAEAALDDAGFAVAEGHTHTLIAPLEPYTPAEPVRLTAQPTAAWLAARARLTAAIDGRAIDHGAALARLAIPARFAAIRHGGAIVALGYAALADAILVLEALAVDPAHRRRGLADACVRTLMAWGAASGARHAALQVQADNAAALALYRRHGFTQLYDYHYRRAT